MMTLNDDPFCPRHGRASRPVEIPGLRCDCKLNAFEFFLSAIIAERNRQEAKHPGRSIAAIEMPLDMKLRILVEEVGEVSESLTCIEEASEEMLGIEVGHLIEELVQVGTCAYGWIESLLLGQLMHARAQRRAA